MHLQSGTCLHRNCFKIVSLIDKGGFGITYLADETGWLKSTGFGEQYMANKTPERVVIKELYFDDFCSRNQQTGLVYVTNTNKKIEFEKLVNKQLEEGRIIKNLSHRNIVNTKDIFKENETAYMVLEYIDGINLCDIVKNTGKLTQDKALLYIKKILSATAYIHEKKVLHLDITPSNILIKKSNDEPILIDFGASQTYGADDQIESTTSKLVVGLKKHYAPIEQGDIDNLKKFDGTFDTYAIGATLYFMLTGTPPPTASMILSGRETLTPASSLNDMVNTDVDEIISKAMSPRYPDRYKTASELKSAIDKIRLGEKKTTVLVTPGKKEFGENLVPEEKKTVKKETEFVSPGTNQRPKNATPDKTLNQQSAYQPVYPSPKPKKSPSYVGYILGGIAVLIFVIWMVSGNKSTAKDASSTALLTSASTDSVGNADSSAKFEMNTVDSISTVPGPGDQDNPSIPTNLSPEQAEKYFGIGVDLEKSEQYEKATRNYLIAASNGYGPAQINLGVNYISGSGASKNYEQAVKWLKKAADQPDQLNAYGNGLANYYLGLIYYHGGYGISQDYSEAFNYYKTSAGYGNADAENNLADMYETGVNGNQNYAQAWKWYKLAADQNEAVAEYSLGEMYENGKGIDAPDLSLAIQWYRLAAKHSNDEAKKALERLNVSIE